MLGLEAVPTELLGMDKMFGAFLPSGQDVCRSVCAVVTMSRVLRQTCRTACHDEFWRRPWQRWA